MKNLAKETKHFWSLCSDARPNYNNTKVKVAKSAKNMSVVPLNSCSCSHWVKTKRGITAKHFE